MYKEAQKLVSSSNLQSKEVNRLKQLIIGGIEFKVDEAKFYGEEFLGVYGLDKKSLKSENIYQISNHIVTNFLEDKKLESISRTDYPIYLIEQNNKADSRKLSFVKSVYTEYMNNIRDRTGFSGFVKSLRIETKWMYLVYLFWVCPTNQYNYYLNERKNVLTVGSWSYSGFSYTIKEVCVSFMYKRNHRLLALTDTNKNTHYYEIDMKTGDIMSMCMSEYIEYDSATLYSRLRVHI